jgi:hypothetical protein
MNRLFGAAKKEEPAPPKKEEPKVEEPVKKPVVPLSEQQAKVVPCQLSWRTRCESYHKQLLAWITKPAIYSKSQRRRRGLQRICINRGA